LPVLTALEDLGLAVLKGLPVLTALENLGLAVLKGLPVLTLPVLTALEDLGLASPDRRRGLRTNAIKLRNPPVWF